MNTEVEFKGQSIRTFLVAVKQHWGQSVLTSVLDGVSTDLRETIEANEILSGGWYPFSFYRELTDALVNVLPYESNLRRRLGRLTTKHHMQGIYATLLHFTSPVLVAKYAGKLASTYYRGVNLRCESEVFATSGTAWFSGFHGLRQQDWEENAGFSEMLLEVAGAGKVTSKVFDVENGSAVLTFDWG